MIASVEYTYLPDRDAGVWVLERRQTAIWVLADEGLVLNLLVRHIDELVGKAELFNEDVDFPWVWRLLLTACQLAMGL